jgi:epoxyqueuosine reductase
VPEGAQHGAHERGLAGPEIAFERDDEPAFPGQSTCQRRAQRVGRGRVGQRETQCARANFAMIVRMQDMLQKDLPTPDRAAAAAGPDRADELAGLGKKIRALGRELGLDALGCTAAEIGPHSRQALHDWLAAGRHGEMDYMARHAALRAAPAELHPGTVSVISARLAYWPEAADAAATLTRPELGYVARYALGRDYHKTLRQRLQMLAERIGELIGPFGYRVFVDSAPVMEVEFARRAGLGWRGKHTLLLSQQGSWHFLGEIFTDLPVSALQADAPAVEHCGRCTRCLDVCPTQAIVAPYQVDARRCISYLTIELKGAIPEDLRPLIGNRIYGCDDCQLVCPWNRFATLTRETDFAVRHGLDATPLVELFAWSEAEFDTRLAGSAIRRIGHERWLRNIAVGLGNGESSEAALEALRSRAEHPSALVREHVEWAIRSLLRKRTDAAA